VLTDITAFSGSGHHRLGLPVRPRHTSAWRPADRRGGLPQDQVPGEGIGADCLDTP